MSTTTKKQTNEPVTGYKSLLIQARNLRSEAGANAYQRAKLLVAVHEDHEFRTDFPEEKALPILETLKAVLESHRESYVPESGLGIAVLRIFRAPLVIRLAKRQ